MPAWWGRKSSKTKLQKQQMKTKTPTETPQKLNFTSASIPIDKKRTSAVATAAIGDKPRSFDEVGLLGCRYLQRNSTEFGVIISGSPSGFSGFESDGAPLPLPPPSTSLGNDLLLNASASDSSVSSSGSSDDHLLLQDLSPFGALRGNDESKRNMRSKSPGPGSGVVTPSMSPIHTRLSSSTPDFSTGKQEEGKSPRHRLPLPPGSPTSPSALAYARTSGVTENAAHVISNWKKGKLLGRGTFGHVYLGFNSGSGQMCAIKEVRVFSDDRTSKECLKQLNQEISLLSQLLHPNIVQYYGSELDEESLSVYLEYVSGGSIHKLLQEYGPFKEPVIQNYSRQILSGLAYLHGRNTVHRDIKGANILVDPNGEIKLADFGMAKHTTNCSSMLSFKGSPYWMAPEVVMNTNGYSLAVDIWSLGCTILEMATSKPPWSQFEGVAAIFKIGNGKDIPEIPEHLSNDAKSFIRLCLQRDPVARPAALKLLDHPFIRDQAMTGAANSNIARDALPFTFDGCHTPPTMELHSNRTNLSSFDRDYMTKPVVTVPRTSKSKRGSARPMTSLPVSPCSSPLRQNGPAYKSCFLSPPHPTYAMMGQNTCNMNDYSVFPTRHNSRYSLDAWHGISHKKAQSPSRSPRR